MSVAARDADLATCISNYLGFLILLYTAMWLIWSWGAW